jgi:hypothetical protein
VGCQVDQGRREGGLAEAHPAARVPGFASAVVERTLAWICHNCCMSKEYERLCASSEAFVYVAMTRLTVRRWARLDMFSSSPIGPYSRKVPASIRAFPYRHLRANCATQEHLELELVLTRDAVGPPCRDRRLDLLRASHAVAV